MRAAVVALGVGLGACTSDLPAPDGPGGAAAACPDPSPERYGDPLVHLGRGDGSGDLEIVELVAHGPWLFACTGTAGVMVWSTESGGAPTLVVSKVGPPGLSNPEFPRCQSLAVAGDRLAVGNRGDEVQPTPWVAVFDIADPRDPVLSWALPNDAPVEGLAFDDQRLWIAQHGGGITAVDPADGTDRGGHRDAGSDAWDVAVVGDDLAVAEGGFGLRVYTRSEPPVLRGHVALDGSARDLVIDGSTAFVAASSHVARVDLTDRDRPQLVESVAIDGTAVSIDHGVDGLVVAAQWDGLRGFDTTSGGLRPVLAERVPAGGDFSRVLAVATDRARRRVYAGEWTAAHAYEQVAGVRGPDLTVVPAALQFGTAEPGDAVDRVAVVRNRGDAPLRVFDIHSTNPAVTASPTCLEIPASSSAAVELRLSVPDGDQEPPPLATTVELVSDDPDEPTVRVPITANVPGIDIGDPAPPIALFDLEGNGWTLDALRGQVVVLAYFATF